MKSASIAFLASAVAASVEVSASAYADVETYITNENCRDNFLHRDVCVSDSECFAHGTDEVNQCTSFKGGDWKWPKHAKGVVPHPRSRKTANLDATEKHVWAYVADVTQGEAANTYNQKGALTVDQVLSTPVNQLAFIANVNVDKADGWFNPGANNTNGCGQMQTWNLPFGYKGKSSDLSEFHANLQKIHAAGTTITLTMGSWCTSFPIKASQEWSDTEFTTFVNYFRGVRSNIFGGALDGIDFDWEGYCQAECLKGECSCDWDDNECGNLSPDALANGHSWTAANGDKKFCWMFPTHSTMQVMTGISKAMKDAGFVVTLVPMSTSMYTGAADTSPNQNLRNEYVKFAKQTVGGQAVNLLDVVDGILLQWYSGFDAGLCAQPSTDKMACACNNVPDKDYPNTLNVTNGDGMIANYWSSKSGVGGYHFPETFPVRCQACSNDPTHKVRLPDGSMGINRCSTEQDDWYEPATKVNPDGTSDKTQEHIQKYNAWVAANPGKVPHWWVKGVDVPSRCPRAIDCPDFAYQGEERYASQLKLLKSLGSVVDISKVSIGFESMGTDVQTQFQAYVDPAKPWGTVPAETSWTTGKYWDPCTQNMTAGNIAQEKRCGQPLLHQEWGPKFSAKDILGLEAEVAQKLGKQMAGIGLFTLDGAAAQEPGKPKRLWYCQLCALNKDYGIKVSGPYDSCSTCPVAAPTPAPALPTPGPAPGTPTPAPPSGSMYNCDWSSGAPTCVIDPTGWAPTKADCTAVCHN